jgi:hypothetical protein
VLVPPADFIPLAEETGLIVPLSEWAMKRSRAPGPVWQQSFGFADSIAVNLPSRLFERSDLVDHIHQSSALRRAAPVILLEITENNLMKDLQNVIAVAAPAQRDRRRDLDRRLRHRLLVAGLPDHAADLRAEDRPQLRARPGHQPAELGRGHAPSSRWRARWACASSPRAWRRCARWKCCTAWAVA